MIHPLEVEIQAITEQYQLGNMTLEERNYLLQEIRDIRAAEECSSDEQMFRLVVSAANIAMALA